MGLIIIWISFIILVSAFQELNLVYYLLSNFLILLFTCLHNFIKPSQVSSNVFLLFSSFPSLIICYITLIYGNFLLVTFSLKKLLLKILPLFLNISLKLFEKHFLIICEYYQLDFRIPLI